VDAFYLPAHPRLTNELQKVGLEEAAALKDEGLAEKDAVRKLITIRATKDVQTARLAAAKQRTAEQIELSLEVGGTVRRNLARAANEVLVARTAPTRQARTQTCSAISQTLKRDPGPGSHSERGYDYLNEKYLTVDNKRFYWYLIQGVRV
jgi:hypothetical protein